MPGASLEGRAEGGIESVTIATEFAYAIVMATGGFLPAALDRAWKISARRGNHDFPPENVISSF